MGDAVDREEAIDGVLPSLIPEFLEPVVDYGRRCVGHGNSLSS
jgi:hypothetical protein